MTFKVSESTQELKKGNKFGQNKRQSLVMTFKVSESIWELKKAKNLGKYKIFLMAGYMIFKYSKLRSIV